MRVANQQVHAVTGRGLCHRIAVSKREGHRLFDNDMLAAGGSHHRMLLVPLMGGGDIDGVDQRVAAQRLHFGVCRCAKGGRKTLACFGPKVSGGHDAHLRMAAQAGQDLVRGAAQADQAQADHGRFMHHRHHSFSVARAATLGAKSSSIAGARGARPCSATYWHRVSISRRFGSIP